MQERTAAAFRCRSCGAVHSTTERPRISSSERRPVMRTYSAFASRTHPCWSRMTNPVEVVSTNALYLRSLSCTATSALRRTIAPMKISPRMRSKAVSSADHDRAPRTTSSPRKPSSVPPWTIATLMSERMPWRWNSARSAAASAGRSATTGTGTTKCRLSSSANQGKVVSTEMRCRFWRSAEMPSATHSWVLLIKRPCGENRKM